MAGDWIKMRLDLQTHPKVVRILSATKSDKFRVIGGLHAVWSVFDTHSVDGRLEGYTSETLDHIIGWPGFSEAVIMVGWLGVDGPETLILPEFDEHNGKSGKRRAEDQKRKRDDRKNPPQSVRKMSASDADKKRTREEKRIVNTPKPPEGGQDEAGSPKSAIALQTFLDACKAKGERPVRDYESLWRYAEGAGLPADFVALAWVEFCRRFQPGGTGDTKRYKDWRKAFRKYVEGNYLKLWAIDGSGEYFLTTLGKQAQRIAESKEAA